MKIIRGKIPGAQKIVIYGPEGIGKTTLASKFPEAVFIDTEGSTKKLDVARFEPPSSWTMLLSQVDYVIGHPGEFRTLVVDTADWAQKLCIKHICDKHSIDGIEGLGYGKGYTYVSEEFGKLLNRLDDVIERNINVVLTAHAQIVKFEQPDEMGAYDRWSMKLINSPKTSISAMVKEWADMVLFCNFKTYSVAVDDKGKKHKAQGGKRVMYTSHHPCWDAKNRDSLPDELPMEYESIRHIIEPANKETATAPTHKSEPASAPPQGHQVTYKEAMEDANGSMKKPSKNEKPVQMELPITEPQPEPEEVPFEQGTPQDLEISPGDFPLPEGIPKALADLMRENHVSEWDIQAVCARRGYYPEDTPIINYDPDFIQGCLVAAWPQVYGMIQERNAELDKQNPFNH